MMMNCEMDFGKVQALVTQLLESVEQCGREGRRVDEVERAVLERLLQIGLETLTAYVAAAGDGDEGESLEHQGQTLVRLPQPKRRTYLSVFGRIDCQRYVYGTREKQKIQWVPWDARLGMPAGEQSYVLEDLLQKLVVQLPYGESVQRLEDFLGVKTTQRATQVMTDRLAGYGDSFREAQGAPPAQEEGSIVVVTLDGKGVPVRRPLEQRLREECGLERPAWKSRVPYEKSRKRRQRGEPKSRKQMAYVGIVYTVDPFVRTAAEVVEEVQRQKRQADRPPPQNKRAWVEMTQIHEGEVSEGQPRLFANLAREARCRNPHQAKPLVCVMDGQRSFRKLFRRLDQVTPILDVYHVLERLWNAAHCFHPDGSLAAGQFVDHYLQMLLEGKVGYVIGAFKRLSRKLKKPRRRNLEKVITYLENNRIYMKYDQYLAAGYPIGSGVVEGACRHVIKDRMEQSGMRWEAEGAQAVLHLRTIYLNGDWRAFLQHRIETEQATLYGNAA
ncbi:MAG TPA: ISKra4 family transposase [Terriglobales bacterium]